MNSWAGRLVAVIFNIVIIAIPAIVLSPGEGRLKISDFPNFYTAAWMAMHNQGALVYDSPAQIAAKNLLFPGLHGRNLPFHNTPIGVPLFLVFTLVPSNFAPEFWSAAFVVFIAIAVQVLAEFFELSRRQTMWLAVIVAFSGPCWETVRIGQLSAMFLLALAGALLLQKKNHPFVAGLCQSVWCPKPHLLLPLVMYQIGSKQWKVVAGTIAGSGALLLASLILLSPQAYTSYAHTMQQEIRTNLVIGGQNEPNFRGQLLGIGALHLASGPLPTLVFIGVCVLLLWLGWRFRNDERVVEKGLIFALPMSIAFALHVHNYDLLLLLPALIAALRVFPDATTRTRIKFAVPLLIYEMPIYVILHYYYVLHAGQYNPFFLVLICYIGFTLWGTVFGARERAKN